MLNEKAQRILTSLSEDQPQTVKELIKKTDSHINTIQKNLNSLVELDLIKTIPTKGYGKSYILTSRGNIIAIHLNRITAILENTDEIMGVTIEV